MIQDFLFGIDIWLLAVENLGSVVRERSRVQFSINHYGLRNAFVEKKMI